MLDDLLRDPKKYEEGVSELLQELVGGRKTLESLSAEEMTVLDRATLDLNRSSSNVHSSSSGDSSLKKKPPSSSEESDAESPDEGLTPDDLVPAWFR